MSIQVLRPEFVCKIVDVEIKYTILERIWFFILDTIPIALLIAAIFVCAWMNPKVFINGFVISFVFALMYRK